MFIFILKSFSKILVLAIYPGREKTIGSIDIKFTQHAAPKPNEDKPEKPVGRKKILFLTDCKAPRALFLGRKPIACSRLLNCWNCPSSSVLYTKQEDTP